MSLECTGVRRTSGERCEVSFSDGTVIKSLLSVVSDFSLAPGRELTEEERESVVSASELGRAKNRALYIIGARPMSRRELYDRLVEKGETEQNAAECVAWLVKLHLLDDAEYASMLVRHYAGKGYGERRVRDELYRRKVPKELWDEALAGMPEQDGDIDRLLRRRLSGSKPDRAELKKATDALLRRGFSWDDIRAAVARYDSEIEEDT